MYQSLRKYHCGGVGIAQVESGYGLDAQGSIPGWIKTFFSAPQYADWIWCPPNGQWEFFPEIKRPGREAGHSHLVLRSRMMELYRNFSMRLHDIVLSCLINLAKGQLYLKKVFFPFLLYRTLTVSRFSFFFASIHIR
jgi:hypothetical protein